MSDENKYLDDAALQTLINAVNTYLEELGECYQFLLSAAEVCQMAMGNDDIARVQIERMYAALEGLRVAALTTEEVARDMQNDLNSADTIYQMRY